MPSLKVELPEDVKAEHFRIATEYNRQKFKRSIRLDYDLQNKISLRLAAWEALPPAIQQRRSIVDIEAHANTLPNYIEDENRNYTQRRAQPKTSNSTANSEAAKTETPSKKKPQPQIHLIDLIEMFKGAYAAGPIWDTPPLSPEQFNHIDYFDEDSRARIDNKPRMMKANLSKRPPGTYKRVKKSTVLRAKHGRR